jgi:hypothetical protein
MTGEHGQVPGSSEQFGKDDDGQRELLCLRPFQPSVQTPQRDIHTSNLIQLRFSAAVNGIRPALKREGPLDIKGALLV